MAFFATKVAKVMVILGAVGLLIMIVGCIFLGIADNIVHSRVSSVSTSIASHSVTKLMFAGN